MQRWLAVSMILVACGAEAPSAPNGQSGTPRTGGAPPGGDDNDEAPAAAAALVAHRDMVAKLIARAGVSVDLDAIARQPIVRARIELDEATRSFTAVVDVDVVHDAVASAPRALSFVVPANAARPLDPPITLDRVEVDGASVEPSGDRVRWTVPLAGDRVARRVTFRIAGVLPTRPPDSAARPEASALDALAELAPGGLSPVVGRARPEDTFGEAGGVTVLHGFVPRLEDPASGPAGQARATFELTVSAASDLALVASGVELGRERKGAAAVVTFVAIDQPDVVVVLARGFATSPLGAGPIRLTSLHAPAASEAAAELMTLARRTLETLEPAWGRAPLTELHIVACPMLDGLGVVALPGVVLVPAALVRAEAPPPKDDVVDALLARHPAPRDGLALAVARAAAAQWWLGRGTDIATTTVLEDGIAAAGALRVIAGSKGDKVARRAEDLGLALPIQLGLHGRADPILATLVERTPNATAKAGLFGAELQRQLSETLLDEALRGLAPGPITLADLRAAVLARAPRRADTEALLARWLDRAHLEDDVGDLDPGRLLEQLVTEGGMETGLRLALDLMGDDPALAKKGIDAIAGGNVPMLALDLLDELTGDKDPTLQKWLDMAKGMLGKDRDQAMGALVDELGAELGIPEAERARLRQMSDLVMKALADPMALVPPDYEPIAPPPPEPERP